MSSGQSASDLPALSAPATEMAAVFRQLQRETLRVVLIVLAVAGLAVMGLAGVLAYSLWAILAGTVTLAIVGCAAWLEPRSGERQPAVYAGTPAAAHFPTPGVGDWVLLLQEARDT